MSQTELFVAAHCGRASDPKYWTTDIAPWRLALDRVFLRVVERVGQWVLRHWLLIANLSNAATVLGAVLTPWLMARGLKAVGHLLFAAFSLICAQNADHSFFVFGYQMAIDQRMLAIYASATLAGLLFVPLQHRLSALPWRWYLILIVPMAVDGFTQLLGWRHSNWELRSATGALFGVASVWWLYPFMQRKIARAMCVQSTTGVVQAHGGQL